MASQEEAEEMIITLTSESYQASCIVAAAAAMLVYHYALSFADEVARWRRPKLSGAFVLYISNRYLILMRTTCSPCRSGLCPPLCNHATIKPWLSEFCLSPPTFRGQVSLPAPSTVVNR
ncbi:hypothetical protein BV20DRAFT_975636 [Pilatotrama ljubarskyi]|nr:hypothetical protein BV20DRAFT_975636 [Pilatotrama ljubarskyi]